MFLKHLSINNFRLFPAVELEFDQNLNIVSGMNGQGKTSILEAIYYLALTRSFRINDDSAAIGFNQDHFDISAQFFLNSAEKSNVRIFYGGDQGKNYFINGKKVPTFAEVIGRIPCVVSTTEDLKLIFGAPADRRRFVDILLSQTSALYLQDLKIYRRILQQRNALLSTAYRQDIRRQLEIWNKQIASYGIRIINRRLDFVDFLNNNLETFYSGFTRQEEQIRVIYKTDLQVADSAQPEDQYVRRLETLYAAECERKTTLSGPHRDDLEFVKDGRSARQFCSLGESKIFTLCLKFCEWKYLQRNKKQTPILLLDDVFGELDGMKGKRILNLLQEMGQVFITTTGQFELPANPSAKNYICIDRGVHAVQ